VADVIVSKGGVTFCAAHRLYGYAGECAFLHGHNYRLQAAVRGPVGVSGMVMDFAVLKGAMQTVTRTLDHATILAADDPLVPVLTAAECRLVVLSHPPTVEILAQWIFTRMADKLSVVEGVRLCRVVLHETDSAYAEIASDESQRGNPGDVAAH
jgi:6-pyruvoyltetrahydropterin/6-carboxytetrahydropterin synthase